MTNPVWEEIKVAAREAPQMYFAPLVGAVKGIRQQYRKLNQRRPLPSVREQAPDSAIGKR